MNRPYSEATVEVAAQAGFLSERATVFGPGCGPTWDEVDDVHRVWARESARAVLDALAAAGLLQVEGRWDAPAEPGPEVKAVRDRYGKQWTRHDDGWCFVGPLLAHHHWRWSELFFRCAPLTDATRADAVRLAVGDSKPTQDHDRTEEDQG